MQAAVRHPEGPELVVEEVDVAEPLDHEVLVRTVASGICGSDLHGVRRGLQQAVAAGADAPRSPWPGMEDVVGMVGGHEGAGIVERVGAAVDYVEPGDHVIACLSVFCGRCENCLSGHPNICSQKPARAPGEPPRLSQGGKPVGQMANMGSFADRMLLHENAVVKVRRDVPLDKVALLSCGATTGLGAVFNTARVEPGSTVAVFGAGGVGLSAVQGAHIAGARTVISVDIMPHKLETALELGATHAINAKDTDPVEAIREITEGGVDYSFEAIGGSLTAGQAFACIRRGGTTTLIGIFPPNQSLEIPGPQVNDQEWTIKRSSMGSNRFRTDIPKYIELYVQGRLKLDEMIARNGSLDEINDLIQLMLEGEAPRTVITFD